MAWRAFIEKHCDIKSRLKEVDTYVEVAGLPWRRKRRRRKRRRGTPGSSIDTTKHFMGQEATDSNTRQSKMSNKCQRGEKDRAK